MQFLDITGVRLLKAYIDNKIPTKTSDLTNDSGFLGPEEEEVIATALNDLNTRVVNVEDFKTGFQNENWVRAKDYSQIGTVVRDTYTKTQTDSEALSGTISLHKIAKTGTYSNLIATPTIPTESTVSEWGFTKNTGTLTGVTFNGSAATVSSGVAAITATIPNITISSSEPTSSQGSNGDIWIVV